MHVRRSRGDVVFLRRRAVERQPKSKPCTSKASELEPSLEDPLSVHQGKMVTMSPLKRIQPKAMTCMQRLFCF